MFEVDVVNASLGAAQGARGATEGAPSEPAGRLPDPEVAALAKRRRFTAGYKRRILRAAAACKASGEVGALLRREGLYSSHLTHWRREIEAHDEAGLRAKRRGPKPNPAKAEARKIEVLERDVAQLRRKLERAEQIIEAQKTVRSAALAQGRGGVARNIAIELSPLIGILAACQLVSQGRALEFTEE